MPSAPATDDVDALVQRLSTLSPSDSPQWYRYEVCQLATRFFLMTFCRARMKDALPQWVVVLKRLYAHDVLSSLWLLHSFTLNHGEWLRDFLFECPDAIIRAPIADVLNVAILNVVPHSLHLFAPDGPQPVLWRDDEVRDGSPTPQTARTSSGPLDPSQLGAGVALEFGHALVQLLNGSAGCWRTFDSFFRVFDHFAASSPVVARWLVRPPNGLLGRLLDLFLGDHSLHPELNQLPVHPHTNKRQPMRDDYHTPEWHHFLALSSRLIVQCQQPQMLPVSVGTPQAALPQLSPSPDLVPLTEQEMALLLYPDLNNGFLVHLLQLASGRKKGHIVNSFITHLCRDNPHVSDIVLACTRRGLEWFDWDNVRSYFRVLTALVQLADSLQAQRVAHLMGMLLEVITRQAKFWKITDLSIDHLIRLARQSPLALQYLHAHTAEVEPLMSFLTTYPDPPVTRSFQHVAATSGISLFKPSHDHYSLQRAPAAYEVYGLSNRAKCAAIDAIMRQQELEDTGGASDSDTDFSDRVLSQGEWVDALDTASKCHRTPARCLTSLAVSGLRRAVSDFLRRPLCAPTLGCGHLDAQNGSPVPAPHQP